MLSYQLRQRQSLKYEHLRHLLMLLFVSQSFFALQAYLEFPEDFCLVSIIQLQTEFPCMFFLFHFLSQNELCHAVRHQLFYFFILFKLYMYEKTVMRRKTNPIIVEAIISGTKFDCILSSPIFC